MRKKKFNQEALVEDLYALYDATVKGIIDPQVTKAATDSAREIGKLLRLKLDQSQAPKRK